MTTSDIRCPSCGSMYVDHSWLIPTCRELIETRAEVERLQGNQEHRQRMYELLSRAEISEAEVLRLREQQGILSNEITLQVKRAESAEQAHQTACHEIDQLLYGKEQEEKRAEAAEQERDRYKAALVESCDNMRAEGPYEGMGICPQLQEVTAERDQYRDIIQQVAGTGQVMGYPHCRCGRCVACLCREALEVKP